VRLICNPHRNARYQKEVWLLQAMSYMQEVVRWRYSFALELLAQYHRSLGTRLLPASEQQHA